MKRRTILIVLFFAANVILFVVLINWRIHKQRQTEIMLRDATRYAGPTGQIIEKFDERTDRWIAEMKGETIEEILRKLTDAAEYEAGIVLGSDGLVGFDNDQWRDRSFYRVVAEAVLGNRRFRAAYDGLQKINKKKAAELLTKNIRDNLAVLRVMLQEDKDKVASGGHTGILLIHQASSAEGAYRPMSRQDALPTRTGRKYAVFSYLLLASLLELQDVRPAIEDVIAFAKEEYKFFNDINGSEVDEIRHFKISLLDQSLYNPSLLVTATLCDPTWNIEKKRILVAKLFECEVVDYQARVIEQDKNAKMGLLAVVPHAYKFKVRYYKGITDAEFNDFFGK